MSLQVVMMLNNIFAGADAGDVIVMMSLQVVMMSLQGRGRCGLEYRESLSKGRNARAPWRMGYPMSSNMSRSDQGGVDSGPGGKCCSHDPRGGGG